MNKALIHIEDITCVFDNKRLSYETLGTRYPKNLILQVQV